MDIVEKKKEIRRRCRALRMEQPEDTASEKSRQICRQILDSEQYRVSLSILIYIATQGEVSLGEVIDDAVREGKTVAAPRISGKTMEFYKISSPDDLEEGAFHVWEPRQNCPLFEPDEHTLFLVPGVAFDSRGRRSGYGGGYYDRYLGRHPGLFTVGIGYDFQILPEIPCEPTDIPMKSVLSEKGWYYDTRENDR